MYLSYPVYSYTPFHTHTPQPPTPHPRPSLCQFVREVIDGTQLHQKVQIQSLPTTIRVTVVKGQNSSASFESDGKIRIFSLRNFISKLFCCCCCCFVCSFTKASYGIGKATVFHKGLIDKMSQAQKSLHFRQKRKSAV